MLAALTVLTALAVVCALSAVTAIVTFSFTNRARGLFHRLWDDVAAVDRVHLTLIRLAQVGEHVLLAHDGEGRFRELAGKVDGARHQLRARGSGNAIASDIDAFDRDARDLQVAVDHAMRIVADDPRSAFVGYRNAIKSAQDAVDSGRSRLIHKLVAAGNDSSGFVPTGAERACVAMLALSVLMSIVFAAGAIRALARQWHRMQTNVTKATRAAVSRHDLLAASKVFAEAEHLRTILDELLDLSRVDGGSVALHREHCDAGDLIDAAARSVQLLALIRSVRISVAARNAIEVRVNRQRMIHALATLLSRAVQRTPPGGVVSVTMRLSAQGAQFTISNAGASTPPNEGASSQERADHHVDQCRLYIAQRLVEVHGGKLDFDGDAAWISVPSEPWAL